MTGHNYLYKAKPVEVLSFRIDGDSCTLVTSGPWVTLPLKEMSTALDDFLEMDEDEPETAVARTSAPKMEMTSTFGDLRKILMENIAQVQKNKEYGGQAKAVSNSVKLIIDMAKVEIEAVKVVRELGGTKK